MRLRVFDRMMTAALAASLILMQPAPLFAAEGLTEGTRPAPLFSEEGPVGGHQPASLFSANDTAGESEELFGTSENQATVSVNIRPPRTDEDNVTTWDCIWFGSYWQEDTNGDGVCFEKETLISWDEREAAYYDQYGKRIPPNISGGRYAADSREPIKWRVLDIDGEGNALLLADRIIDIVEYNEKYEDVTWETSTVRSYLNSLGAMENRCRKDFSGDRGFLYRAFTEDERNSITCGTVHNPDNPLYGTSGGADTTDRIFCLSLDEARTDRYGFHNNEMERVIYSTEGFQIQEDPARVGFSTGYVSCKPGYGIFGLPDGRSIWFLRSPGETQKVALVTSWGGQIDLHGEEVRRPVWPCICGVRPALRMNLLSSTSMWAPAGTVASNRNMRIEPPDAKVIGVTIPENKTLFVNETLTLTPEIEPSIASDRSVTWESSRPETVSVNQLGEVTGLKEGTAEITVRTNDGGFTDTCVINVEKEALKDCSLIPGEIRRLSLGKGGQYIYAVRWSIEKSDPKGCVRLKNGVVTAKKAGNATVTAETETGNVRYEIRVDGSVPAENRAVSVDGRTAKITAPKTVTAIAHAEKAKTVTVSIPKALRPYADSLSCRITDENGNESPGAIELGSPVFNNADHAMASKVSFEVIPSEEPERNAAFIIFSLKNEKGEESVAVTKVLVKRPVDRLIIDNDPPLLETGDGYRLNVFLNDDNTDPKDLVFSVKMIQGKGIRCSRSGFVTFSSGELAEAVVTVKSGKISKQIRVLSGGHVGNTMVLAKTSVTVKKPKEGKSVTTAVKVASPKEKTSAFEWKIEGEPEGIDAGADGRIRITSKAVPGSYRVTVSHRDPYPGYNTACCELIVR